MIDNKKIIVLFFVLLFLVLSSHYVYSAYIVNGGGGGGGSATSTTTSTTVSATSSSTTSTISQCTCSGYGCVGCHMRCDGCNVAATAGCGGECSTTTSSTTTTTTIDYCGDGTCGRFEDACSCLSDCSMNCAGKCLSDPDYCNQCDAYEEPCLYSAEVICPGGVPKCSCTSSDRGTCAESEESCGNGKCDSGENYCNCQSDCFKDVQNCVSQCQSECCKDCDTYDEPCQVSGSLDCPEMECSCTCSDPGTCANGGSKGGNGGGGCPSSCCFSTSVTCWNNQCCDVACATSGSCSDCPSFKDCSGSCSVTSDCTGGGTTTSSTTTSTTTPPSSSTTPSTSPTTSSTTTSTSSTTTTIDSTPPSITVQHSPSTVTQTDTVTIDVTSSDPSGISETRIYVNGNLNKTCSSSTCSLSIGPFTTGISVSYHAEAEDNAGNVGSTPTKSFTVNCKGPDCVLVSVSKGEFHLKPEEGDTLTVNLTSTSVDPERIEVSVLNWDGDHEFRKSTCSHCGCAGCGYSGSGDKEKITLEVPAGGHSEVDLWFSPRRKKRPGRYVFNVKTEGA